jgi:Interferon-induced transmembrane protein
VSLAGNAKCILAFMWLEATAVMTLSSSVLNDSLPQGIDAETIAAALDRRFKSQGIATTVKLDPLVEIQLVGLSNPHPDRSITTIEQVLGKLQISARTVKVVGMQTEALEPSWEREISISPIAESSERRTAPTTPARTPVNVPPAEPPANHMLLAVLGTCFGVWPLGIVAISYAVQVNSKYANGDTIGAERYANNAKRLSVISLGISGAVTSLIFLALILPLFLGGSPIYKAKQEKAAAKYLKSILHTKLNEVGAANASNNRNGFSEVLNPPPPQDIEYKFESQKISDTSNLLHQHLLINGIPTRGNLKSFAAVVYTTENGMQWMVKSDACVSKSSSFYPPTATITNGNLSCSADSTLASQSD